jgi:excisionase family DNA binding protein
VLLSLEEAAERLRCKPRFTRRLVAERRIRFTYVGRTPHIPESAIAEYIEAHMVYPVSVRWRAGKVA